MYFFQHLLRISCPLSHPSDTVVLKDLHPFPSSLWTFFSKACIPRDDVTEMAAWGEPLEISLGIYNKLTAGTPQSPRPTASAWTRELHACCRASVQLWSSGISLHHLLGHLFLSQTPAFWFHCWLLSWFMLLFKSTSSRVSWQMVHEITFFEAFYVFQESSSVRAESSLSSSRILD